MLKQKLIFCSQKVNKKHIRRENRRGVEHVILTSFTLPPDIVMNRGLYPADEVLKSFKSLNRTPVTIEHPEIDGQYVSANDPEIDFDFRFGAFNENAEITKDGRVSIDKVINVQKALMSDKGKRLLDRISELETSDKPRPMHTSVGVFVDAEELDKPQVNEAGDEFSYIARNMIFDHDAILLDSIGAATPDQGTGIGINSEVVKVEHFVVNGSDLDDGEKEIQDDRLEGKREIEDVILNNNQPNEDNAMRDEIIAKLKVLGLEVNSDISDADLLAKYEDAQLKANVGDEAVEEENLSANSDLAKTVQDQAAQIETLKDNAKADKDLAVAEKIKVIKANEKYSSISENSLKAIHANSEEDFDAMHQDSIPSYGIGSTTNLDEKASLSLNTKIEDLPE